MSTIFDYLDWRGDISFDEDPFNMVDNLVLSELAYTYFDGLVPEDGSTVEIGEVRDAFFKTHTREEIMKETNPIAKAPLLMDGMVTGKRFGKLLLSDYVDIIDEDLGAQMSAVTFRLSDGTAYIAFRGTDSTIVGWKEDFNMGYMPVTEGQRKAVEYLDRVGARLRQPIRVGGHSKGGNFAVFASAFCSKEVKERITEVYTNDGPGFGDEIMEADAYKNILSKVISIVPDTSIIGMLLTSSVAHHVVRSCEKGLMQHDALTWQVKRNRFVSAELSDLGKFIRDAQKDWLSKLDNKMRESFVNTLFSLFEATGMDTFDEMGDSKLKSAERIISSLQDLPKDKQRELLRIFRELLQSGSQTVKASIKQEFARHEMQND